MKEPKEVKAKAEKPVKWEDVKAFIDKNREGIVCHIYTTADDCSEVVYFDGYGAVVHKAEKNYFVISTGKVVDIK